MKQLYNLLWFCKKVQIPFEVYAFTQEWSRYGETLSNKYEGKDGVFRIDEQFNLMNLFTSKVNSKTLEDQMIYTWRIAHAFRERTFYSYPDRLRLSGTPLNEALVCLHQILPQFQKENNVEKVQCIVLTDVKHILFLLINLFNVGGKMNLILEFVILIPVALSYGIVS